MFDCFATFGAEFDAGFVAAFEDFDAVVGVGVVAGGDVNGEIEAHMVEAVIDGRSGKDADAHVFDAESFEGGLEVLENPFGGLAVVAADEDFDVVVGVVD